MFLLSAFFACKPATPADTDTHEVPVPTADTAVSTAPTGDTGGEDTAWTQTDPICDDPFVTWNAAPLISEGWGWGSSLHLMEDGRLLMSQHGNESTQFFEAWHSNVDLLPQPFDSIASTPGLTDGSFGGEGTVLGQLSFPVGDSDGDGSEDVVLSVFAGMPMYHLQTHAAWLGGPFVSGVYSAYEVGTLLDEVAWDFERCDVNGDGLADLCSVKGVALAPPPFDTRSEFADATGADRIAAATVGGVAGQVFWRSTSGSLAFVPHGALPPEGQATAALATQTAVVADRVLDLTVADVLPEAGDELVGTVDTGGRLGVVVWSLEGGFVERFRVDGCTTPSARGAVEVGDYDGDGALDLAFASGGTVGLVAGPPDATSVPVWWERHASGEFADLVFGFDLLTWEGSLLVGYPGVNTIGTWTIVGGELHRLATPLEQP